MKAEGISEIRWKLLVMKLEAFQQNFAEDQHNLLVYFSIIPDVALEAYLVTWLDLQSTFQ